MESNSDKQKTVVSISGGKFALCHHERLMRELKKSVSIKFLFCWFITTLCHYFRFHLLVLSARYQRNKPSCVITWCSSFTPSLVASSPKSTFSSAHQHSLLSTSSFFLIDCLWHSFFNFFLITCNNACRPPGGEKVQLTTAMPWFPSLQNLHFDKCLY